MREIISPLSGIRSPFGGRSLTSPLALFAFGEPGVWFDPSDVANLNWRRNLLTWTQEFDNAAWTKFRSAATANAGTDPLGGAAADKLVPSDSLTAGQMYNATPISAVSGVSYAGSVYVKAAELGFALISNNVRGSSTQAGVCVNLTTGARSNEGANGTYTVTDVGNGWWRVSAVTTATNANGYLEVHPLAAAGLPGSYTGNGTSGILIWGAQLELGSVATDYQRITDVNTEVIERFPNATLYQDTAGTTPVTTTGQSVGLMLDKSKGLVLGSELVTNGDFSAGSTGWGLTNVTVSGGVATFTGIPTLTQSMPTTSGVTYRVTMTISGLVGGSIWLRFTGGTPANSATLGNGVNTFLLRSNGNTSLLIEQASGAITAGTIDNISVKELPGNHAVQATTGARPNYGIHPVGGRRNLLVRTEEFDNASWAKSNATITANTTESPVGTITADTLTATVGLAFHYTPVATALTVTGTYTHSIYVKKGTSTWMFMTVNDGSLNYFNFDTGLFGTAPDSPTVTPLPNGWFRLSVTRTLSAQGLNCGIGVAGGNGQANFTAAGTETLIIWGAQGELGSTATAYQRVTDQYNVTEAGVSSVSYLFFDGVNDSLATPTITPGVDKAQVFAGVRKLSDPGTFAAAIVESSGQADANNGAFLLFGRDTFSPAMYEFGTRGTTFRLAGTNSSAFAAPITNVLTGIGDIAGDVARLRINGNQVAETLTDQGTGNFLAYPLYIGARNGSTLFFNGHLYSLIARFGPNLAAGQISSTETWVASRTGIVI